MTSEVSENTAQNDQSISEISSIVDELNERYINNQTDLPDNTDSHVISRASLEIDTLEAEVSQGCQSFLMPKSRSPPAQFSRSHHSFLTLEPGPESAAIS